MPTKCSLKCQKQHSQAVRGKDVCGPLIGRLWVHNKTGLGGVNLSVPSLAPSRPTSVQGWSPGVLAQQAPCSLTRRPQAAATNAQRAGSGRSGIGLEMEPRLWRLSQARDCTSIALTKRQLEGRLGRRRDCQREFSVSSVVFRIVAAVLAVLTHCKLQSVRQNMPGVFQENGYVYFQLSWARALGPPLSLPLSARGCCETSHGACDGATHGSWREQNTDETHPIFLCRRRSHLLVLWPRLMRAPAQPLST